MKIVSMEPTPSPYSMKINVNKTLPDGQTENYKSTDLENAPDYIKKLFAINGVKGLYRVIDFIALERNPRVSWEEILPEVRKVLGAEEETTDLFSKAVGNSDKEDAFGEVKVFIQMFRNLPTQVKLQEGENEQRFALPERFMNVAMEAATASNNYLMERKWVEQSARYGNIEEIGSNVVEELSATYDSERLNQLLAAALKNESPVEEHTTQNVTLDMLDQPNWRERYAALDRMDPTEADFPVLNKALDDEHSSVRRLATAYLGMIEEPETLPYLYKALKDKSVNVRRTAGDCLSDLGFKEAIPEMINSLSDKSRIVRWRAAMFLYEVGDETAIPALQAALEDPEFEVRMQAKMALARIEQGKEAEGSIWYQMSQATKEK
ncbi:conserved virulence factor C family protein [Pseudogracilibacillus sp. SO30301A]|uniref:conserved virulence factor C family protein n=1 Tax=Pseudogracilibacillus sp. SO30301A TaxID=3098291 RepID=UPI00300DD39A